MYKTGDSASIHAIYTVAGVPTAGLTVTCAALSPAGVSSAPAVTDRGGGIYRANVTLNEAGTWVFTFNTAASVDSQTQIAAAVCGQGGVENLDATISSRSTLTLSDLNGYSITISQPVITNGGEITLYKSDDYAAVDERTINFAITTPTDLTDKTVKFYCGTLEITAIVTALGSDQYTIAVPLSEANTDTFSPGSLEYQLRVVDPRKIVLAEGRAVIKKTLA